MKKTTIAAVMFTLLAGAAPLLVSQELNCTVTVNMESIQSAQRGYLRTFAQDIERYMNNTKFSAEDLDGEKIQCSLDIFFSSATSDNRYVTQIAVSSQRPIYIGNDKSDRTTLVIRILDNKWSFTYTPNQRMNHDEMIFDPLTGFLDFYAYLIIGYDLETYVPMSGSACFQKALNTVQLASNSSVAQDWQQSSASYTKYGITDELTSVKYNGFRTAFNNYHFDGIDLLATEKQKGLDNMLAAIESINEIRIRQNSSSVVVKQFFDAKFREIAEAFQSYPDRSVYEKLSNFDQEHRSTYQEWKAK
ncbi:MAG: DUF4835 family protein [Ignavibacteriae bacterium]|nr:MAG: DUF4835 family protein [Ignavibacteriota bacterium]